ncbi:N-acetyl-gamma-glutamyl-phosphate reductase [Pontibacillus sp. HMF3514]|uniref:N-acetyl-gamma-glutamyl-phosphate reductase n=1 Tax=Pontibacillus sp. HMF3514 TaxID=2692425 RepID=UPI00131F725E|nr:N-acetyl-gamma-glutamyl-phosphate reductase [Pontibacillus sp. HMF3514]QHE52377.1 N-acetyl-gamma-glutamyl-phosphate reductase [Pontibacillus sp. HMF3514]
MKVGIIGANGYGGVELIRLLQNHPFAEIELLVSHSTSGTNIKELYPHLLSILEMDLAQVNVGQIAESVDVVFFSTPPGVSLDLLPQLSEKGVLCIDLSGDHRLIDSEVYSQWYQKEPASANILNQTVYGLSELNKEKIKGSNLIANPGCYPTATLLGILPVIKEDWVTSNSIIIDGKTGVSGAGRKNSLATHFSEVNENVKAYKLGTHQHIPEIEQLIESFSGNTENITFSAHLVPMTRGIMCTIYADLKEPVTSETVTALYQSFYENHPFVRVRETGDLPKTKEVYGSNYCDIGIHSDERTNRLTIVSVIDNLVKGAAGQAVQNMNLLFGWDETTGLTSAPIYP